MKLPPPIGFWNALRLGATSRLIDLRDARRALGAVPLFHRTIGAAIRAGRPWLSCYCPGCGVFGQIPRLRSRV